LQARGWRSEMLPSNLRKHGEGVYAFGIDLYDASTSLKNTVILNSGTGIMTFNGNALAQILHSQNHQEFDMIIGITQYKGIGGAEPIFTNGQLIQSIPDAIAKVLETHIGAVNVKHQDIHVSNCPICGTGLNDEKCPTCANCGWSKCNGV